MKKTATSKAVRDLSQQAIIENDTITIKMKCGQKTVGKYSFLLADWLEAENGPSANPNWNRIEIIRKHTQHLDNQSGGDCQADRIRDAQVCAIQAALKKN